MKLYPYLCNETVSAELISKGGEHRIQAIYSDGRFAKELFRGELKEGKHTLTLDLSGVSPGILHIIVFTKQERFSGMVCKSN